MDLVRARRLARNTRPSRIIDTDYFPFAGGLNLVDTPLKLRPGQLLAEKNYEPGIRGGYSRLRGFERFDGRLQPSEAVYWLLNFDSAAVDASLSAAISGATSAASGVLLATEYSQPITHVNRFLRSTDLTHAEWTKTNLTAATDGLVNPLGTQTHTLMETAVNAAHSLMQSVAKPAFTTLSRATYWVRANGCDRVGIQIDDNAGNGVSVDFSLSLGSVVGVTTLGSGFSWVTQELTTLGSGWFRISLTVNTNAAIVARETLFLMDGLGAQSYLGVITNGIYVAGSQFERAPILVATDVFVTTDGELRGNGAGYYILSRVTGTFVDNEDLDVASDTQSRSNGIATTNSAATDALHASYLALAIADARAQIGTVPGSGSILGVAELNGVAYAARNNAGGTAAAIFRSSAAGWVQVVQGFKLRFDAGQPAGIADGDGVTGLTSGATGTARRVVVRSGTFAASDAVGYLIFESITGIFLDNEALQVGGTTRATADGTQAAQVLAPNGKYEFRVHNFYGHTFTKRLYGVDGQSKGFEIQDGLASFFSQIDTGMVNDKPTHLGVHKERLYFSFTGGSVQRSGQADPAVWSVVTGATEFAIGEEVSGFLEEVGQTLFVFGRNKTYYLAGAPPSELLEKFNQETGSFPFSIQRIGQGMYLDDRGFTSLATSDRFGNYAANAFSALVQPLVDQLKLSVTASCIVRDRNLYRCFFSDGRFFSIGLDGTKITGHTISDYGKVVRCVYSGEDLNGREFLLFGSDDGYVYRAEKGTSFDGAAIQAFARLVFHFSRRPSRRKRYRRAQFDIGTVGRTSLSISVDYSFSDPNESGDPVVNFNLQGGGGFWDVSNWDQFLWNTGSSQSAIIKLEGAGINIGFLISHESATEESHSLDGVTIHESVRRMNRGTANV